MTGKPMLKQATIMMDFGIVDLWERTAIYGSPDDLLLDPYLFKIIPLTFRTWMYHEYFGDSSRTAGAAGENAIIEDVLSQKAVDTPLAAAGRWSPTLCYFPVGIASIGTADWTTVLITIIVIVFNLLVSVMSNSPGFFRKSRPISFGPRLGFFFFILARVFTLASKGGMVVLSCVVMLGIMSFDFIAGDYQAFVGVAFLCNYTVLRRLPNRLFVCRKNGAAFLEDPDCHREVSEKISGTVHFPELSIIAELRGLVVLLRPMARDDWVKVWEQRSQTSRPASFIGLDVFNKEHRTIDEVDLAIEAMKSDDAKQALLEVVTHGNSPSKEGPGFAPPVLLT
jgi:hypothetical protein